MKLPFDLNSIYMVKKAESTVLLNQQNIENKCYTS